MSIAALFNRKVHTTLDVAGIEGGKKPAEALILESARALLAAKDDAPVTLHEVDGGFVVQGSTAAVLFADTGDVEFSDLPESKSKDKDKDKAPKTKTTTATAASATAFNAGAFRKLGEANKTIGFLLKKNADEAGWPALFETYVKGDADMEAAYAKFAAPAARVEHVDPTAPGAAILAIKNVVQGAHDRIQAAMHEGVLTEAQLDEYMQVAPLIPYAKPLKADGACIGIGGGSVYLSQDDFFTKVPHYAVAEYLLCLAVKDAIDDGALDAFIKAIRASLASSPKVKALEVELVESAEVDAATLTEGADQSPEEFKASLRASAKGNLKIMQANAAAETDPVKKKALLAKIKSIKARYESEGALTEESPEAVVIVVSDEAVELRADDEDGAIIASAAYNEADAGSLDKAHAEVLSTAEELGYDVGADESTGSDLDETAEAEEALVGAVLEENALMASPEYLAIVEALDSRDGLALEAALKAATHPRLKPIAEGFASRKHVRGRKPSGKTIPRKGNHLALQRKALTINPPVDVGPGAGKGGAGGSVSESTSGVVTLSTVLKGIEKLDLEAQEKVAGVVAIALYMFTKRKGAPATKMSGMSILNAAHRSAMADPALVAQAKKLTKSFKTYDDVTLGLQKNAPAGWYKAAAFRVAMEYADILDQGESEGVDEVEVPVSEAVGGFSVADLARDTSDDDDAKLAAAIVVAVWAFAKKHGVSTTQVATKFNPELLAATKLVKVDKAFGRITRALTSGLLDKSITLHALVRLNGGSHKPLLKQAQAFADKVDQETEGPVSETWIDEVRRMSVTEFASAMLEAAATDTAEAFTVRVAELAEGYAAGVGQKDLARKITAVNPIIKKRLGRGLDLESVSKTTQTVETVMVVIPHSILDEALASFTKDGIPADAEVRILGESIHVRVPRTVAEKLVAAFPLAKLT